MSPRSPLNKLRDATSGWMPEVIFLLFKVAESILEPACRIFVYESVCLNLYGEGGVCDPAAAHLPSHVSEEVRVQQMAARYMLYYKMLVNLPAMVVVLCCGVWSDSSGRKLPILLTCMGTATASLIYMLSFYLEPNQPPFLPIILLGAGVRGAFGRSAIMTMSVNSYVADGSSSEKRTQRLSNLVAMSHFGYLLGSSAAGVLLDRFGFGVVFVLVIGFELVCVLASVTCLRENGSNVAVRLDDTGTSSDDTSTDDDKNTEDVIIDNRQSNSERARTRRISFNDIVDEPPLRIHQRNLISDIQSTKHITKMPPSNQEGKKYSSVSSANQETRNITENISRSSCLERPTQLLDSSEEENIPEIKKKQHFFQMFTCFGVLFRNRPGRDRLNLWLLFIIISLHQMNKSGETDILLLFVKKSPLSLTRSQYGYLLSANYACLGLFAFFLPKFLSCTGMKVRDSTLAIIGTAFKITHLIAISFSSSIRYIFFVSVLVGPHSLSVSTVKSMVSKLSDEDEMGKTFSLVSSWETMSNLMGSLLYTTVYSTTAHFHPGISFFLEAAIYAVNLMLLMELACSARQLCNGSQRNSEKSKLLAGKIDDLEKNETC